MLESVVMTIILFAWQCNIFWIDSRDRIHFKAPSFRQLIKDLFNYTLQLP